MQGILKLFMRSLLLWLASCSNEGAKPETGVWIDPASTRKFSPTETKFDVRTCKKGRNPRYVIELSETQNDISTFLQVRFSELPTLGKAYMIPEDKGMYFTYDSWRKSNAGPNTHNLGVTFTGKLLFYALPNPQGGKIGFIFELNFSDGSLLIGIAQETVKATDDPSCAVQ